MSVTTPTVHISGSDGIWRDASSIIISTEIQYGKNQPFMFLSVKLVKPIFNTDDYWQQQYDKNPTHPLASTKPKITVGTSRIRVNTYGEANNLTIVRINDSDDGFIEFIGAQNMYRSKSITIGSLFNMVYNNSSTPTFSLEMMPWMMLPPPAPSQNQTETGDFRYTQNVPFDYPANTIPSSLKAFLNTSKGDVKLEMIEGNTTDLFKWISWMIGNYSPFTGEMVVDSALKYKHGPASGKPELTDAYASHQIVNLREEKVGNEIIVKVRPDMKCWDLLKHFGNLTLRTPFFYDKAYFVNYEPNNGSTVNTTGTYLPGGLIIDYGANTDYVFATLSSFLTPPHTDVNGVNVVFKVGDTVGILADDSIRWITGISPLTHIIVTPEMTAGIALNLDQGERYLLQSQTVASENFEWTSYISDRISRVGADDIKTGYPDLSEWDWQPDDPLTNPEYNAELTLGRKYQTKLAGMHKLVEGFEPQSTIRYNIIETRAEEGIPPISIIPVIDVQDFDTKVNNGTIPQTVGTSVQILSTREIIQWNAGGFWKTYAPPTMRVPNYKAYSIINTLVDRQNSITINKAPLALTTLLYPQCVTELTWGYPEFQDAEQQVNNAEQYAIGATQDGTGEIEISDKWASKLSIGNQTLSQIEENFVGFSGIVIVKNRTSEVYEIRGYSDGDIQTTMGSDGKFTAGSRSSGNFVQLDMEGLTIMFDPTDTTYFEQSAIKFRANDDTRWEPMRLYTYNDSSDLLDPVQWAVMRAYDENIPGGRKAGIKIYNTPAATGPIDTNVLGNINPLTGFSSSYYSILVNGASGGTFRDVLQYHGTPTNNGRPLYISRSNLPTIPSAMEAIPHISIPAVYASAPSGHSHKLRFSIMVLGGNGMTGQGGGWIRVRVYTGQLNLPNPTYIELVARTENYPPNTPVDIISSPNRIYWNTSVTFEINIVRSPIYLIGYEQSIDMWRGGNTWDQTYTEGAALSGFKLIYNSIDGAEIRVRDDKIDLYGNTNFFGNISGTVTFDSTYVQSLKTALGLP